MPPQILTRDQVRNVDRIAIEQCGMSSLVLMENAARGCFERLPGDGAVVICCGRGNNGGDGFAIARHLDNHGRACRVFLFADPSELSADAAANWRLLEWTAVERTVVPNGPSAAFEAALESAEWIIDALLGTGAIGPLREPFASVANLVNESEAKVASVDIPTGLDADSGIASPSCVSADRTWTFVAEKPGLRVESGPSQSGEIFTVDIGVPARIIRQAAGT